MSFLHGAGSAARHTVAEIASSLYPDTSKERLVLAEENVEKILLKLHFEGRAICLGTSGRELQLHMKGYDFQMDKTLQWSHAL